jgi:uncharacterized protein (TIGR02118 family)
LIVVKVIALLHRRPDLSVEEFLAHWETVHAAFIRALPGIRRYRQNHAVSHRAPWPYDGAAEVWFDSIGDVARAFSSPAADAMREDEQRFIADITWFLVEEHEIPLFEGAQP